MAHSPGATPAYVYSPLPPVTVIEKRSSSRPRASRAVGTALGGNPLCLVLPCHRVLPAGGGIGGYAGGPAAKEKLLTLEATAG